MSYESTVLARNPLFYLPVTETAGSTFADLSGNGHAGAIDDPSYPVTVGGADGPLIGQKAAVLTVRGSQIDVAAGAGFGTLSALTLEYWLRLGTPASGDNDLDFAFDPSSLFAVTVFSPTDAPALWGTVYWGGTGARADFNTFGLPHFGCWHHHVYTYDGSAVRLYLDGALLATRVDPSIAGQSFAPPSGGHWRNSSDDDLPINLNHVALYAAALTATEVAENYVAATPRQDADCFVEWARLSHAGGQGFWQSKGDVTEEWAGGAKRLLLPFPTAAVAPADVLGKDAVTGLPTWSPNAAIAPPDTGQQPLPAATVYQTTPAVPAPPAPDPVVDHCPQITCGAAVQLAHKLRTQYDLIRGLLIFMLSLPGLLRLGASSGAPLGKTVIVWVVEQMIKWLIKQEAEKWVIAVFYAILAALSVPGLTFVNTDAEDIGDAGEAQLAVLAYSVLACSANVFQLTPEMVANWGARILLDTTDFTEWQRHLLVYCIQATPFWTYDQTAASGAASPSDACAGWTGP